MAKHRKRRIRAVWIKPTNVLYAVILHSPWHRQEFVLCSRCLAKRRKCARPTNKSIYKSRGNGEYYQVDRWNLILPHEKVACHDCGFKMRGKEWPTNLWKLLAYL